MQLPIKAHYATLAMLALSEKYESRDVLPARAIAVEQGIPNQFLTQILQQLRAAGLISSTRGSAGGFYLDHAPCRITVGEVVDAVCPPSTTPSDAQASPLSQIVSEVWDELKNRQRDVLDRITLADLIARSHNASNRMFYI